MPAKTASYPGPATAKPGQGSTTGTIKGDRMSDSILIRGARLHNLKNLDSDPAEKQTDRVFRPFRLGEIHTGVRHPAQGRPAAVPRIARYGQPPEQAARRPDRRTLAFDQHRPGDHQPQPAFDGRNRDRNIHLPAGVVRPSRPPAVPALRGNRRTVLPPRSRGVGRRIRQRGRDGLPALRKAGPGHQHGEFLLQ